VCQPTGAPLKEQAREKRRPAAKYPGAGRQEKIPAATYSPTRRPCSTIGSEGLNCRVRDGNGWNPFDVATGNLGKGFADAQAKCRGSRGGCRARPWPSWSDEATGREETTKPHERLVPVS